MIAETGAVWRCYRHTTAAIRHVQVVLSQYDPAAACQSRHKPVIFFLIVAVIHFCNCLPIGNQELSTVAFGTPVQCILGRKQEAKL